MNVEKGLVPQFETEEEEAEYWDTHSPLDVAAEPEAQQVRVRVPKDRPITIRLDSESRGKLERLAAERGLGPSTFARLILMSAIEHRESPPKSITLGELIDVLEMGLPQPIKDKAESLIKAATLGGNPDEPAFLLFDQSQMMAWGEVGLQAIATLLAMYNVQIITEKHSKYEEVKTLVQSCTRGR